VLGFHVDYWDRLGWKDRFSSAAYTSRQKQYAAQFSLSSIYTPQVVVNGEQEAVGSNVPRLDSLIRQDLQSDFPSSLEVRDSALTNGHWRVFYRTNAPSKDEVHVALVQLHAQTAVHAGENDGATLSHVNVVRDFETERVSKTGGGSIDIALPDDLKAADARLIVFVQDPHKGRILKATQLNL
jgi:hypothetical protein